MTIQLGADVSVYQKGRGRPGMPGWMVRALDRRGLDFLMARATIGTERDPTFRPNMDIAERQHWVRGAYAFMKTSIDPERQAAEFVRVVAGQPNPMLMALDVEWSDGELPSRADVRAWVKRFRDIP